MRPFFVAALSAALAVVPLLSPPAARAQGQVNVYNWSDYIAEPELKRFERETGVRVNYTTYDSNEILEAKLRAGRSGYDVVVPTASPFFVRQLSANLYRPLDKAMERLAELEFTAVELDVHEQGGHLKPVQVAADPDAAIAACRCAPCP